MGFSDFMKDKARGATDQIQDKLVNPMTNAFSGLDKLGGEDESVVILYPDSRFRGQPSGLKEGRFTYSDFACGNDAVSSVRVRSGYKVILFEHVDFKGRMRELTEDTANLGSFNKICSSAIVEKR